MLANLGREGLVCVTRIGTLQHWSSPSEQAKPIAAVANAKALAASRDGRIVGVDTGHIVKVWARTNDKFEPLRPDTSSELELLWNDGVSFWLRPFKGDWSHSPEYRHDFPYGDSINLPSAAGAGIGRVERGYDAVEFALGGHLLHMSASFPPQAGPGYAILVADDGRMEMFGDIQPRERSGCRLSDPSAPDSPCIVETTEDLLKKVAAQRHPLNRADFLPLPLRASRLVGDDCALTTDQKTRCIDPNEDYDTAYVAVARSKVLAAGIDSSGQLWLLRCPPNERWCPRTLPQPVPSASGLVSVQINEGLIVLNREGKALHLDLADLGHGVQIQSLVKDSTGRGMRAVAMPFVNGIQGLATTDQAAYFFHKGEAYLSLQWPYLVAAQPALGGVCALDKLGALRCVGAYFANDRFLKKPPPPLTLPPVRSMAHAGLFVTLVTRDSRFYVIPQEEFETYGMPEAHLVEDLTGVAEVNGDLLRLESGEVLRASGPSQTHGAHVSLRSTSKFDPGSAEPRTDFDSRIESTHIVRSRESSISSLVLLRLRQRLRQRQALVRIPGVHVH